MKGRKREREREKEREREREKEKERKRNGCPSDEKVVLNSEISLPRLILLPGLLISFSPRPSWVGSVGSTSLL
jgi:hypothetical protein